MRNKFKFVCVEIAIFRALHFNGNKTEKTNKNVDTLCNLND